MGFALWHRRVSSTASRQACITASLHYGDFVMCNRPRQARKGRMVKCTTLAENDLSAAGQVLARVLAKLAAAQSAH